MNTHDLALFDNPAPRCPVVLLLDTSGSMSGAPIAELNAGIQQFFEEVHADEVARFSVETCLITFGNGGVMKQLPFSSMVKAVKAPSLCAGGGTPLAGAVELGLQELHGRREFYKKNGISAYKPWMVIMSDGMPDYGWQDAAARACAMSDRKELVLLGVGIGDGVDMTQFTKILPANRPPKHLRGLRFKEFFQWLSDSLRSVSQSSPGQQVHLPPTSGWESI